MYHVLLKRFYVNNLKGGIVVVRKYKFFGTTYETSQTIVALFLLVPIIVCLSLFFVYPMFKLLTMSFTSISLKSSDVNNVGFNNYLYVFKDPKFYKSIINTFVFAFFKLMIDVVLSLLIAMALDKALPIRRLLRIAYFAPVVVPVSACALIWIWFYDPGIGPLNQILQALGGEPLKWLYDEKTALMSVIIFSVWKGLGYNVVLLLAGLQNIPDSYIEAAKIDGATGRDIFTRIQLPLLSPTLSFVIMIGIVNTFKMFTEVNVLTPNGGPLNSTLLIVSYVYQIGFVNGKFGRGAAAAIALFIMIFILTLIQKAISKKTVFYD